MVRFHLPHMHCRSRGRIELSEVFRVVIGKDTGRRRFQTVLPLHETVFFRIPDGRPEVCNGGMDHGSVVQDLHSTSGEVGAARTRIRVVLADDHQELLDEIRRLLVVEFDVVCSVSEGLALVKAAFKWRPDVIVSDIKMPHLSGAEAARQILQKGLSKAAIMLTMYNEWDLVRSSLEAGILGYVLKVDAGEELIPAIRRVVNGQTYLSRRVHRPAL